MIQEQRREGANSAGSRGFLDEGYEGGPLVMHADLVSITACRQ
jgi:hypothetical protein